MIRAGCRWLLLAILWATDAPGLELAAVGSGWPTQADRPHAGDRLLGWTGPDGNPMAVADPFEWLALEQDRGAAGAFEVRIEREGEPRSLRLPAPGWDWEIAANAEESDAGWAQDWSQLRQAEAAAKTGDFTTAYALTAALAQRRPAQADRIRVHMLRRLEADPDRARGLALALALEADVVARKLDGVRAAQGALASGRAHFLLRDYPSAANAVDAALARAGETRHALVAQALELRGSIAYRRGDNTAALADFERAESLLAALAPASLAHAQAQGRIAAVALSRGEFAAAERMFAAAIATAERAAPASTALARLHFNAGLGAFQRRRLGAAQEHAERALALFEAAARGTAELAMARSQLAEVLSKRGEESRAEALKRAALAQALALSRDSFETLSIRMELAYTLRWQQRADAAREQIDAVLAHEDLQRPETLFLDARQLRAQLALEAGDAASARSELVAILPGYRARQRRLPLAQSLLMLAAAERLIGAPVAAAAALDEALPLVQAIAPETSIEAEAHLERARLLRADAQTEAALASYRRAQQCLERQRDYLGGDEEARARWGARYEVYYREPALWLLQLQRGGEAWEQIERWRAREFLAALGERQALLAAGWPAALRERAEALAESYLRALRQAAAGTPTALPEVDLAAYQAELAARAPRLAALAQTARVDAVAAALPRSSVLLSFLLDTDESHVLVLRAGDREPQLRRLAVSREQLAADVDALRLLLARPDAPPQSQAALQRRARDLHARLLAPLGDLIGDARRLLIVADGPLLDLPFAALVSRIEPDGQARWLAQDFAISMQASASAWLAAQRLPAPTTRWELTALAAAPAGVASDGLRDSALADLPGARDEAREVSALFAPSARLHLDAGATVAVALSALRESRRTHFASHAVLDPRDPLAAWLQLSPDAGDDGRLRAIDLMRGPLLASRLVTLSACETAAGAALGGEGLLGLARAFQYAGVPTVVGTRWRVADRPTQVLMRAFYSALAQEQAPDLALQSAQRRMIEQRPGWWARWRGASDLAHPAHWAGFVIVGTSADATRESP